MKRKQPITAQGYPLVLFAMLLLSLLLLTVFGTSVYSRLQANKTQHEQTRASLAYLATQVRGADTADAVSISQQGGQTVLVLRTDTADGDVYATRIYLYGGYLVEDFAKESAPLAPDSAQKISLTNQFAVEYLSDTLLCFTTQQGTAQVALRSAKGAG